MSISHCLRVIATQEIFSYLSSLGPNFGPPPRTLTWGDFFSKLNGFLPGSEGRPQPKVKLIASIFLTDWHTKRKTGVSHLLIFKESLFKQKAGRYLGGAIYQRWWATATVAVAHHLWYIAPRYIWAWVWPFKVICEAAIGLPTYGFLLMFNSNIGPN